MVQKTRQFCGAGISVLYTSAMSLHSTDPDLNENEVRVLASRDNHGWFVNIIAEDATGPGLAYSFGLYEEFQHPEIIIFGLPGETMHRLINDLGNHVRRGAKYSAGNQNLRLVTGLYLRVPQGKSSPLP